MPHTPTAPRPGAPAALHGPRRGTATRMLALVWVALTLRRSRRSLLEIDDRILRDIGISPDAARAEARRPVWDVPQRWLR